MRKGTVLVGALGALMVGAPAAQAARPLEVAVQDDAAIVPSGWRQATALDRAKQLRAKWVRINVAWAWTSTGYSPYATARPATIAYDFSRYDQAVAQAKRRGINTEITLMGPAPAWAAQNRRVGGYRPDSRAFGEFARQAAVHFRARGVTRFTIWNEPNLAFWLSPRQDAPRLYRNLYTQAYGQIKRVAPRAQVLIGETAPYPSSSKWSGTQPLPFVRALACRTASFRPAGRCAPLRADGYAHHAYATSRPPAYAGGNRDSVTLGTMSRLTSTLDRLARVNALSTPGRRPLQVYVTEYGYHASGPQALPVRTRARYLPQALSLAQRTRGVKQLLFYMLFPPTKRNAWDTSLLTSRGAPTAPFTALRSAADAAWRSRAITR
jgi:hypothetical protein